MIDRHRADKALPDSWQTTPMPAKTARLPFTGSYSHEEYELLVRGLVPREMEDKWFIFEKDGTIAFHRSWTGICVYEVRLERDGERYRVAEARANDDFKQYGVGSSAERLVYEARLLRFLIENLLLGRARPFPLPRGIRDDAGIVQHVFSGTGYPAEYSADETRPEPPRPASTQRGIGPGRSWISSLFRVFRALRSTTRR